MLAIVTPAADPCLLSLQETKSAVGVETDDFNPELDILRSRVAAAIARACRIKAGGAHPPTLRLEVVRQTIYLPAATDELVLARRPLVDVSAVTISGEPVDPAAFEADEAGGILYHLSGGRRIDWPPRARIVVEYSAGWDDVPADLQLAAAKASLLIWSENGLDPVDPSLKREKIDGIGEIERWVGPASDPALPAEVMDLLAPFREGGIV